MKWFRRKPPAPPAIPPYQPPIEVKAVEPKPAAIEVKEGSLADVGIDVESLTQTGVHRAWNRFTGKLRGD
jgi:hypothetical protein